MRFPLDPYGLGSFCLSFLRCELAALVRAVFSPKQSGLAVPAGSIVLSVLLRLEPAKPAGYFKRPALYSQRR